MSTGPIVIQPAEQEAWKVFTVILCQFLAGQLSVRTFIHVIFEKRDLIVHKKVVLLGRFNLLLRCVKYLKKTLSTWSGWRPNLTSCREANEVKLAWKYT